MIQLNLKDKKILYELDFEARKSLSQIGKAVGLPAEVIHYRIKKLEKEGIIKNYLVMIDLSKIGVKQFKMYFNFQNLTREAHEEIISYLKNVPEIKWAASCFGIWEVMIAIEGRTLEEINKTKNSILSKLGDRILDYKITQLVDAITYRRNYLIDRKGELNDEATILGKEDTLEIDKLDEKILKELSKNGKMSSVEVAEKIKSTERIVRYRIKTLKDKKILLGCKIAVDYEKYGYKFFKCFIKLKKSDEERIKDFSNYCKKHKNIIHHVEVLGEWSLEPEFEVANDQEFYNILSDIRDEFADIIKSIDSVVIVKEHFFNYF